MSVFRMFVMLGALGVSFPQSAATQQLTRDDLIRMLAQRDAAITTLRQRLDRLESMIGAPQEGQATSRSRISPATANAASRTGTFEVDLAAAERALERTLVTTGVTLLPQGAIEIAPALAYSYVESDFPVVTGTAIGERRLRRHRLDASLQGRIGLPWQTQFELSIPYRFAKQKDATTIGGVSMAETRATGALSGDVGISIARTLWREQGWRPETTLRLGWDSDTGRRTDRGIAFGDGFHELTGELDFTVRDDPLVHFATVGYSRRFKADGLEPGDQARFSIGSLLALSPVTSMFVSSRNIVFGETTQNGAALPGTDGFASSVGFGLSHVLSRRSLLSISAGIGVTDDAADYTLGVSVPVRFGP